MLERDNLDGIMSPFLRRRRFRAAAGYVSGRVLDFGCGVGLLGKLPSVAMYVGIDIDEVALAAAAVNNPAGRFYGPHHIAAIDGEQFDTVVALAVIEHLPDPVGFLKQMAGFLATDGHIVLTTPNPALDWAHGIGAKFGIFAKESHEEHQSLMGRRGLTEAVRSAGLRIVHFRRFLAGANQLAILKA